MQVLRRNVAVRIERNLELLGKLFGIEWAAREITAVDFDGRHLAAAFIHAKDQFLGVDVFVHVDFFVSNAALVQELFRPPAIGAPARCVEANRFHGWF